MRRKWTLIASFLIAALILLVLFRSVSLEEVLSLIRRADRNAVYAFFIFSLSTTALRVWRYRIILSTNGYQPPLPGLFLTTIVRNTCSDLFPARIGTLVYVFLATTRLGIPLTAASSSFALSFLFDLIGITPLIIIALLLVTLPEDLSPLILGSGALALLLFLAAVIKYLPEVLERSSAVISRGKLFPGTAKTRAVEFISSLAERCRETQRAGIFVRILTLSVLIRLGKYVSLYFFLLALLRPLGYELEDLSFATTFLGLCASEMAASLPISGIAGFGAYQLGWVFTFTLLGFPSDLAVLTSLSHHIFTQLYGYSLGCAALLLLMLPCFARKESSVTATPSVSSLSSFLLPLVAMCAVTTSATWLLL